MTARGSDLVRPVGAVTAPKAALSRATDVSEPEPP
jgi:hypothetical protein